MAFRSPIREITRLSELIADSITGPLIRTAETGPRITIGELANWLLFYSGRPAEQQAGALGVGASSDDAPQVWLETGRFLSSLSTTALLTLTGRSSTGAPSTALVRADNITMQGALEVTADLTAKAALSALKGLTVAGGRLMANAGLTVSGGQLLAQAGAAVSGARLLAQAGATVSGGSLLAQAGATVSGGQLLAQAGATVSGGNLFANGGLSVPSSASASFAGPVTVRSGGAANEAANMGDVDDRIAATLADTGWVDIGGFALGYGAGSPAPQARRVGNVVTLRGKLTSGDANGTAAVIPVGLRPAADSGWMLAYQEGSTRAVVPVRVFAGGGIYVAWSSQLSSGTSNSSGAVNLAGLTFMTG